MPQSPGGPGGISFSMSRAVVENGPDKLKLIPQGIQHFPETEALRCCHGSSAAVPRPLVELRLNRVANRIIGTG
jgi:hypothetical protein